MGFPGYFLIVADFINWAKANGCPVGPGRGSGAGSLVAYALFITDLDPLQYKLLFERFLNPERVSMPDFDIDFCQGNRDRVIDYVKDKYGRDAVSQIATFGTMASQGRAARRGPRAGHGLRPCGQRGQADPGAAGQDLTLAKVPDEPDPGVIYARKEAPELEQREGRGRGGRAAGLATRVEGIVRNIGMHAGGVLIAPGKITDFCPLYQQPGSDSGGQPVRQGRRRSHRPGEVRLPGPGHADHPGAGQGLHRRPPARASRLRLREHPAGRPAGLQAVRRRPDRGVFQFESRGMQGMLRDAKPSRLEDLIALNALYRPGPMDHPELRARASTARRWSSTRTRCWSRCWARPTASWSTRSR
jgi:DNA polymerase-3 subunit alpha